jgi:hypothetical protein
VNTGKTKQPLKWLFLPGTAPPLPNISEYFTEDGGGTNHERTPKADIEAKVKRE